MKILWLSNSPHMHTGYGLQTQEVCSRLARDGHEIHILCTAGLSPASGVMRFNNYTLYPIGRDPFGNDMVDFLYNMVEADCLITLGDLYTFNSKDMPTDPERTQVRGKKAVWVAWSPFDHDPLGFGDLEALRNITVPIAMSQHGKALMNKSGFGCEYIPHGINTGTGGFYLDRDAGIRFRQFHNVPQDAFLITFVGYNRGTPPTRKGIEYLLQAVIDLNKDGYKDIHLYLHTDPLPIGDMRGSLDLTRLTMAMGAAEEKGITIHLPDPRHHILGYPTEYLRAMYNAGDVFCLPSGGEGFGIPIIEAQACHSPVIVTHWTSMPELVGGGWTVGYAALTVAVTMSSKRAIVDLKQLKDAILLARDTKINHPDDWMDLRRKARTHAENYQTVNLYKNLWQPFMKRVEEDLVQK